MDSREHSQLLDQESLDREPILMKGRSRDKQGTAQCGLVVRIGRIGEEFFQSSFGTLIVIQSKFINNSEKLSGSAVSPVRYR